MKKIVIPVALLLLLMLKKKKSNVDIPIEVVEKLSGFKKTLFDLQIELFADNNFFPNQTIKDGFIKEILAATMPNCEVLYTYLTQVLNGENIPTRTFQTIDILAVQFPKLFEQMAKIAVQNAPTNSNVVLQYRTAPNDLGGNGDFWQFLEDVGNNLPYGRTVIGVAKFIANLFCGKRCKLRRLQNAGAADSARLIH